MIAKAPAPASGREPPGSLRRMDARMVSGLPEPESREAMDWLHDALAALQRADPRPDVDLSTIEERLLALEARPLPGDPVDLHPIWDALGALAKRLNALEDEQRAALARIAALESASAQQVLTDHSAIPQPQTIVMDPLDPASWSDVGAAKAALLVLVTREAARRCGHAVELYEEMVLLDAKGDDRSRDDDLRLLQHEGWAKERGQVEIARLTHNAAIARLESVESAARYPWQAGWPESA